MEPERPGAGVCRLCAPLADPPHEQKTAKDARRVSETLLLLVCFSIAALFSDIPLQDCSHLLGLSALPRCCRSLLPPQVSLRSPLGANVSVTGSSYWGQQVTFQGPALTFESDLLSKGTSPGSGPGCIPPPVGGGFNDGTQLNKAVSIPQPWRWSK